MDDVVSPSGVRRILIASDRGEAGEDYAEAAAEADSERGLAVALAYPPARPKKNGKWADWNDLLRSDGIAAVREALARSEPWQNGENKSRWPGKKPRRLFPYEENREGLIWRKETKDGEVSVKATNFCARIVEQTSHDDGAEIVRRFKIEACRAKRHYSFMIAASEFPGLNWVPRELGASAFIAAGPAIKDHARAAIQIFSPPNVPEKRVYGHMGWREIDGLRVYLHAGGAIGAKGTVSDIETDFGAVGQLSLAVLPDPPLGKDLKDALRSSLFFLELGPYKITAPLSAAIWRSTFGSCDFSVFMSGPTGVFKTQLAALAQQHFGPGFVATRLPGDWASTANSLEAAAFAAKDAIFTVDDLAPEGSRNDVDRMHREAARLLRSQGNASGRGRMRPDGSLRPAKPPRGLILSTGEDLPRGQSIRARTFIIEVRRGDIDAKKLTSAQTAAACGQYASAMAAFLAYLADTPEAWTAFEKERDRLRMEAKEGEHARTPWIVADLLAALKVFFAFAVHAEATGAAEAKKVYLDCSAAIAEGARDQAAHQGSQDPVIRFLELVGAALATGKAHLANPQDGQSHPSSMASNWGWQRGNDLTGDLISSGELIGWTEGETVWLEPSSAFGLAQRLATAEGTSIALGKETLWRRIAEAQKLVICTPGKNLHKKKINGQNRSLLAIHASNLRGSQGLSTDNLGELGEPEANS